MNVCVLQSRHTFRKIVLKRAFKKRKEYEQLIERVDMLKSLEVSLPLNTLVISTTIMAIIA